MSRALQAMVKRLNFLSRKLPGNLAEESNDLIFFFKIFFFDVDHF